jgi:tetraacyldisaccharide 4'-kinase
VQAIVRHLAERGLRVGIIARGYGRSAGDCREVNATSDPAQVGDEPLLHARNCRVPVFVGARRADAARALLRTYPGTDVIVSDDGLQHYALARDIEICLFDERGVGNGWLLPAGPLREPPQRTVDFVLGGNGFAVHRSLAQHATRADGTQVPLTQLPHPLTAVAGIAKPDAFFSMLRDAGLAIERTVALPDHYDFTQPLDAQGAIVCTEKDAVKLWHTRPDAWAVPLAVEIDAAFWPAFDSRVDAKLSSRRGSQTA